MYGLLVDIMTFNLGLHLKVNPNIIELCMGCIFWMVHVMTKIYMQRI